MASRKNSISKANCNSKSGVNDNQDNQDKRIIPITRQTNSVLALEFRNMSELFEREMKRMNEEMSKFSEAMTRMTNSNIKQRLSHFVRPR